MSARMQAEKGSRLFLTFLSWLMALCGAWLLSITISDVYHRYRAEAWPTTQGTITRAEAGYVRQLAFHIMFTEQWSDTRYEYFVGSQRYTNSRVAFGTTLPSDYDANALAVGRPVTVRYNPAAPHESVLFPGGAAGPLAYAAVAFFFFWVSRALAHIRDEHPLGHRKPGERRRR